MRLPRRKDLLRLRKVARGPHYEETMVQRQLDQVYDQLTIVEDECPVRVDQPGPPVALCPGLPFEEGACPPLGVILAEWRTGTHGRRETGCQARAHTRAARRGSTAP
jgi:hypothetical protein